MSDGTTFPWARDYDPAQLGAFIEDLWGAASGDTSLATLDAIEAVIARHRPAPTPRPCPLSKRELEILGLFAVGENATSAGQTLGLNGSVRGRCPQIYARLGARTAAQAVTIALHEGWLTDVPIPDPVEIPPHRQPGPRGWNLMYQATVEQLRARPGTVLPIGPYWARKGARGAAASIRAGRYVPFRPAGHFDAKAELTDGKWFVLARYIGDEPAPDERSPERPTS